MSDADNFIKIAEQVARHFWGDPTPKHSKPGKELRWGKNGSKSLRLDKGTWYDNEAKEGGGVLDLVKREASGIHDAKDAVAYLREQGFDLPDDRRPAPAAKQSEPERRPEIVATYSYADEAGKELFQVVRFEPKTFRQRKPDKKVRGGYDWKMQGVRIVPYRLPQILAAISRGETIFVVEGEKAADKLVEQGLEATCSPMGAGKWRAEFAEYFVGCKRAILLPDNDDVGRAHMNSVGASLKGRTSETLVLDLPGIEEKEDVFDWLAVGNTPDDLFELVDERARRWTAEIPPSSFGALRWQDLDLPGEELQFIVDDYWTAGGISVNAGPSKSGKSFLLIDAGMTVALHATEHADKRPDFFGQRILTPGLVVYHAGEGARGVKNRLRAFRKHFGVDSKANIPFVLLTKKLDLWRPGYGKDELSDTDKLIAECKAWQTYYDLPLVMVVIDTLATASAGADENSAKDMTTVLTNCERVKEQTGAHVALVHHMNAGNQKVRGHSSIYANVDQVVLVTRDEETKIRTALLDKQKDGEEGKLVHFELKVVELGTNQKTGKAITSCVILNVGESTKKETVGKNWFRPSDEEKAFLVSLFKAIKDKGQKPADGLPIPPTVQTVVQWPDVRSLFRNKIWIDEADEKKEDQRVRTAASRCGKTLMKFGVIGREGNWLWWTGRPIAGKEFKHTQHYEELPLDPRPEIPLPNDIEDFLK